MPHVFGWQHILYLVIFFGAAGASLAYVKLKVKNKTAIDIAVKCIGGALLALIVFNRIAIGFYRGAQNGAAFDALALIPDSFCGMGSLLFALCAIFLKRDNICYHFLVYMMFWGGLIAIIYPDFIGQAEHFMYPATISGMLHHSVALYLALFVTLTGHFKPTHKKFYAYPLGLCIFIVYGAFLMDALGFETAMYIGKPLIEGTIVTWYTLAPVLIFATMGLIFLYEYIEKKYFVNGVKDETE